MSMCTWTKINWAFRVIWMDTTKMYFVYSIVLFFTIVSVCECSETACDDDLPQEQCSQYDADGECFFNVSVTGVSCLCHKTCHSSHLCPGNHPTRSPDPLLRPEDRRCDCFGYATVCGTCYSPYPGCPISDWSNDCPRTCFYRNVYVCPTDGSRVENPHTTIQGLSHTPRHGDVIERTCEHGYTQVNGSRGLAVCMYNQWLYSKRNGELPVCEIVNCGVPTRVPYASSSINEGKYGDYVSYTCKPGTVKVSGLDGRRQCNAEGLWTEINQIPMCRAYLANYRSVPSVESTGGPILRKVKGRGWVECGVICLNSYHCVGFTFDDVAKECLLNESGEISSNTKFILISPY